MYPIITISREVGSGGHTIGEKVAETLGLPFLDRGFINEVTKATGFDLEEVEKQGESGSVLEKYMNGRFANGLYLGDDQDKIFKAQKEIILEHARKGPCVIVGRCADYIMKEEGIPSLKVFIYADPEYRLEEYRKRYEGKEVDLKKLLKKKDKGRRFFYRYYTDQELGDSANYDLCLCSSALGIDLCVDLIVRAATAANRQE